MQETHLKKVEKTDILSTLRSFAVGDSEFIPYSDSRVDVLTWRSRYGKLRKDGAIKNRFKFYGSVQGTTLGTLIVRIE